MALPAIDVVLRGGAFHRADTLTMTSYFAIFSISLCLWSAQAIYARAFYAAGNTLTPMIAGTIVTLISIPIYRSMYHSLGPPGLAHRFRHRYSLADRHTRHLVASADVRSHSLDLIIRNFFVPLPQQSSATVRSVRRHYASVTSRRTAYETGIACRCRASCSGEESMRRSEAQRLKMIIGSQAARPVIDNQEYRELVAFAVYVLDGSKIRTCLRIGCGSSIRAKAFLPRVRTILRCACARCSERSPATH